MKILKYIIRACFAAVLWLVAWFFVEVFFSCETWWEFLVGFVLAIMFISTALVYSQELMFDVLDYIEWRRNKDLWLIIALLMLATSCHPLYEIKHSSEALPTVKWNINTSLDWHYNNAILAGLSRKEAAEYARRKVGAGMLKTPLSEIEKQEGMALLPYLRGMAGTKWQ